MDITSRCIYEALVTREREREKRVLSSLDRHPAMDGEVETTAVRDNR